ncbi:hypothetical protein BD324DRAFT_648679 [Kockovaella imperatae]|uniref:DUF221-domain-containing protein n=1 Tax=Kockovaella imperatae TaxID=4999 RepID=A0A1Y1UPT5_9TREE|nr:hypothetical protein BD324DRAFT_648679 [Kockovaella imperatae]ORX40068.1 hypothetical protein BD324DRAFT_648679 [Kockovaella imperatae]
MLMIQHLETDPRPSNGAGGDGVVDSTALIEEAEDHFNVSGTSVLAAWGLTLMAGIMIITLYSLGRRKSMSTKGKAWAIIWLPRIKHIENKLIAFRERHKNAKEDPVKSEKAGDEPEEKYRGLLPPRVPKIDKEEGLFSWFNCLLPIFWKEFWQPFRGKPLERHDHEMLKLVGMDAVTYLQYLRMLRWLFLSLSIFVAVPLALANYYLSTGGDLNNVTAGQVASSTASQVTSGGAQNATDVLDNLQKFTAAGIQGNTLSVHIVFEWVTSSLVLAFVIGHSWYHGQLLHFWVDKNQSHIAFRTILLTDFRIDPQKRDGKKTKSDVTIIQAKDRICRMLGIPERERENGTGLTNKDGTKKCTVVLNHKILEDLSRMIAEVKKTHYPRIERSLFTLVNLAKDPTRHLYANCLHRFIGKTKSTHEIENELEKKADDLHVKEAQITVKQRDANTLIESSDDTPIETVITSAFVTFVSSKRAFEVLADDEVRRRAAEFGFRVDRAPRPDNIVWNNLSYDKQARRSHTISGYIALSIIFAIYTVPLMFITVLANVDTVADNVDWLGDLRDTNTFTKVIFTALAGVLPPAVAAAFAYVLPYAIRWLDKWSGALSRGELDKHVIKSLFAFQLFSSFVVFSLFGVIWETYLTIRDQIGVKTWSEIVAGLGDVPTQITKVYISESSYWLSWYPVRCAVVILQLIQLPRLLLKAWQLINADQRRPTQLKEIAQPRNFELFAMGVALIYTPLAPLVVIAATLVFWVYSIVHQNIILYVEEFKETDGKVWQVVKIRLLAATVLMQLLMTLTIALKTESPFMTVAAFLPCSFFLGFYHIDQRTNYFSRRVDPRQLVDSGYGLGKPIPYFKHELLDDSWKPDLHWVPTDKDIISEITEKHWWAKRIFRRKDNTNRDLETGSERKGSRSRSGSGSGSGSRSRSRPKGFKR